MGFLPDQIKLGYLKMNDTYFLSWKIPNPWVSLNSHRESGRKWKINDITKYTWKSANTSDFKEMWELFFTGLSCKFKVSFWKGKMKRGYRLKANHFRSWSRPMKVISNVNIRYNFHMFLSRDIDIKLCQNYTKIHIF